MLEALGNIGDFVGGLAVVVTLVYLAIQVRQNSKQIERNSGIMSAATHQQLTQIIIDSNGRLAMNREFAELLTRARSEGLGSLDDADRARILGWISSLFRQHENCEQLHAAGLVDRDEYEGRARIMKLHLQMKGTRQAWEVLAQTFPARFQARIRSLIEEADVERRGSHRG